MGSVLAVGIATLDIVNSVDGYPAEDDEVRAVAQRVSRGGNATNTLAVLAQLGHATQWAGVWVDEPDGRRIRRDLDALGVGYAHCRVLSAGKVPTSYINLNTRNGARSIVHYRDLPEFGAADFAAIDLTGFDWLHFEGRNVADTVQMLERSKGLRPELPCSVEIEKPRDDIERLFPHADVLLFSPDYARHRGCSPEELLTRVRGQSPADLFCTAGAAGAVALDGEGRLHRSRAFPPARVVDTLGAGDTFNAAVIDGYLRGLPVEGILGRACGIAGVKVGQTGLNGLDLGGWVDGDDR